MKNMEIATIPLLLMISGLCLSHQMVRKRESPFLELYGVLRADRRFKPVESEGEK